MNAPISPVATDAASYAKREHKLFINGQWQAARSGKTFDVLNPATGELLAKVAEGDAADVDLAVDAAAKAFPIWSALPPAARSPDVRGCLSAYPRARRSLPRRSLQSARRTRARSLLPCSRTPARDISPPRCSRSKNNRISKRTVSI